MNQENDYLSILAASGNSVKQNLLKAVMERGVMSNEIHFVKDGKELMEFLKASVSKQGGPLFPCFILLNLNMPLMDEKEALRTMKNHPQFKKIPIVVLTSSTKQDDFISSCDQVANSFIHKPEDFEGLVRIVKALREYCAEDGGIADISSLDGPTKVY